MAASCPSKTGAAREENLSWKSCSTVRVATTMSPTANSSASAPAAPAQTIRSTCPA